MFKSMGVGRFVDKPEVVNVGDTVVVNFTLAVHEYRQPKNGEKVRDTYFFQFEAWDSGARTIAEKCEKGDMLLFSAQPRQQRWIDKVTGKPRSAIVFRIESFTHIPKRENEKVDDAE